ncbi:MAG: geranylgeranyl reductase family protein [Candidatus Manganitrophus sp.]|nr:geranylgeranyl reductase family protein [Candidatus Manganitrophus sp.]
MHYDVIIIGAGPSGSAAAAALARAGRSVLVLEKETHPRHKSCGGGLSARLLPYLDADLKEIIEREIRKVVFLLRSKEVCGVSAEPVAYLVRRPRFDAYLAEKARKAGAEILENCPMIDCREIPEGIEVQSRRGCDTASFLIGADGATSRVARKLHPGWKKQLAFSLEAELPLRNKEEAVWIDLAVPRGYGWIFPKENGAAVGIADFKAKVKNPQALYRDFLGRHPLSFEAGSIPPNGCTIPIYRRSSPPLAKGRVLLVGDAGGLVDPLFGEGIFYAVRSGQIAAEAIIAALAGREEIASYDRAVRGRFYPDFERAERMAKWIYAFPRLYLEAIRIHPGAIDLYLGILRGERTYCQFWREVQWAFFRKFIPFKNTAV